MSNHQVFNPLTGRFNTTPISQGWSYADPAARANEGQWFVKKVNNLYEAHYIDDQGNVTQLTVGGVLNSAEFTAAVVTIGADAALPNERALTGTANQLSIQDNGAGSTVVLSLPSDLRFPGTTQHNGHATVGTNNAYDLGASGTAWRSIYFATQSLGPNGTAAAPAYSFSGATTSGVWVRTAGVTLDFSVAGVTQGEFQSNAFVLPGTAGIYWASGAIGTSGDLSLFRDAANTLAQRNGTTPQTCNIYNTFTDASNYERLTFAWSGNVAHVGAQNAGTGTARALRFIGGNTACWEVTTSQHFVAVADNTYDIGASGATRPRTGYFGTALAVGTNPATTGPIRIANNSAITARNAANSANVQLLYLTAGDLSAFHDGNMTLSATALTVADALNLVVGSTTGTKIGTATTQKIGFYNATPIVQGASVADATGGATIDAEARTAINALISRIEALGLIATV